jgi:hypothetical protein
MRGQFDAVSLESVTFQDKSTLTSTIIRYLEYIFTRCTEMGGGAAEFALYLYALETTLYLSRKRRVVVNDNDLKVVVVV